MALRRIRRAFCAVMAVCLAGIIVTFLMLEMELSRKVQDPWTLYRPFTIGSHCTTASEALLGSTNHRRRIVFLNSAGYLGYNISRRLAKQGNHVTMVGATDDSHLAAIVRRHSNDSARISEGQFTYIIGEMCDHSFLKHIFSLYIPTYVLILPVDECAAQGRNKDAVKRLGCATNILEAARNFQGIRVIMLTQERSRENENLIFGGPVKRHSIGDGRDAESSAVTRAVQESQKIAFNIYRNVYDLTVTTVILKVPNVYKCGYTEKRDGRTSDSSRDDTVEANVNRDVVAEIVPKLSSILRIRNLCLNYNIIVNFPVRQRRHIREKEDAQSDNNRIIRKRKIATFAKSQGDAPKDAVPLISVAESSHIRQTTGNYGNKSFDIAERHPEGESHTHMLIQSTVRNKVPDRESHNLVLSCQFVNFRNSRKKSSRFEITKLWYWGLKDHGLQAVVLHEGLKESYVKRVSDRNISFHRVNMKEFTKSAKFFVFLDYLSAHPNVDQVILTDNSDVRFQRNPFELMDLLGDRLYVGTDADVFPNMASMAWLVRRLEECFGRSFAQSKEFYRLTQMPYVYNAGVIGGPRHLVMKLLEKLTFVLDGVNQKAKNICNMAALNLVLHRHFADKVFTGYPWNSRYLRRQKAPKGVYVIHK